MCAILSLCIIIIIIIIIISSSSSSSSSSCSSSSSSSNFSSSITKTGKVTEISRVRRKQQLIKIVKISI